jgi:hypothetical protein
MTFSNTIWLVNLTLEILCFRRLISLRVNPGLTVFVGWQLVFDLILLFTRPLAAWPYIYWGGHSLTYVLLLFAFVPATFRSLSALYWVVTLSLTVLVISDVWLYAPRRQYALGLICGALALFSAAISYAHGPFLPRSVWAGIATWCAGQILWAAFPQFDFLIYPTCCAVALALFLVSTYASYPIRGVVRRLDSVRLPLGPRFFRRRLRTA